MKRDNNAGLELEIKEGGQNLSTGEKQLISISRAILRKTKIVCLDEATANIDINTEHVIQQLIHDELRDCTVITVAHRLNTIIQSDRVLVLSYGEVAEFDKPQDLLKNSNSIFYSLVQELKRKEESEE